MPQSPHESSHVSQEHYTAFGRIVHAFARVETILAEAIRCLLKMSTEQAAVSLSQYGYEQLRGLLQAMIEEASAPKNHKEEFLDLIAAIHKKAPLRNNVAHSVWRAGRKDKTIKPFVLKMKGKMFVLGTHHNEKDWTAEELHAEADDILLRLSNLHQYLVKEGLFVQPKAPQGGK